MTNVWLFIILFFVKKLFDECSDRFSKNPIKRLNLYEYEFFRQSRVENTLEMFLTARSKVTPLSTMAKDDTFLKFFRAELRRDASSDRFSEQAREVK